LDDVGQIGRMGSRLRQGDIEPQESLRVWLDSVAERCVGQPSCHYPYSPNFPCQGQMRLTSGKQERPDVDLPIKP